MFFEAPLSKMSSCQLPDGGHFGGMVWVFPGTLVCSYRLSVIINSPPFHFKSVLV